MGKALLLIVLGSGLFLGLSQLGTQQMLVRTSAQQADYEDEVVAREIARSGFNMAMGIARQHQTDLWAAVHAINGASTGRSGEHQGGQYNVSATLTDGFTIEIRSTGTYRDADHVMTDNYQVRVLHAQECSTLRARFIESQAGYCSGVYMQRYPRNAAYGDPIPDPEMIFPVGRNGDNTELDAEYVIPAGTQMDFYIGVDKHCSRRPMNPGLYNVLTHVFDEDDYDHLHHAIEFPFESFDYIQESVWGFVEQHPDNDQRWRIGWEDQHRTEWDIQDPSHEHYSDPARNFWALKRHGYDGDGWPMRDSYGYRSLRDYSGRPDYSDQVIEVWLEPIPYADQPASCRINFGADGTGNGEETGDTSGGTGDGGPDGTGDGTNGGDGTGGDGTGGDGTGGDGTGGDGSGGDDTISGDDTTGGDSSDPSCGCARNKVRVWHVPPGNPNNAHAICISPNGARNGHLPRHDGDYIMCEGE